MNTRTFAFLKIFLRDMQTTDERVIHDLSRTINNRSTTEALVEAGCPSAYIEAIRESMTLSSFERMYCAKQILFDMTQKYKKTPS